MRAIDIAHRIVVTCKPDERLSTVAKRMLDHWINSVFVIENDKPIGLVTDGIIFRLIAKERNLLGLLAKDVMVSPVYTIHENTNISDTKNDFLKTKVKKLALVNDEGKLTGILSKRDVDRFAKYSFAQQIIQRRHEISPF